MPDKEKKELPGVSQAASPEETLESLKTSFPPEYEEQIREVFWHEFHQRLNSPRFFVDGEIEAHRITLKLGYLEDGRIKQNNFSLRFHYDPQTENVKALIHEAVDILAGVIDQFIASEESDWNLPRQWKKFVSKKKEYELMYSTENTDLEAEADRLLLEAGGLNPEKSLVRSQGATDVLDQAYTLSPKDLEALQKRRKDQLH